MIISITIWCHIVDLWNA